jgi:hypothetical protein
MPKRIYGATKFYSVLVSKPCERQYDVHLENLTHPLLTSIPVYLDNQAQSSKPKRAHLHYLSAFILGLVRRNLNL